MGNRFMIYISLNESGYDLQVTRGHWSVRNLQSRHVHKYFPRRRKKFLNLFLLLVATELMLQA